MRGRGKAGTFWVTPARAREWVKDLGDWPNWMTMALLKVMVSEDARNEVWWQPEEGI